MSDTNQYADIEKLLGIEIGSTKRNKEGLPQEIANTLKNQTQEISTKLKIADKLQMTSAPDLVKNGISLESLEIDRASTLDHAKLTYNIAKALLDKLYDDIKDRITVSDKMALAAAKLIDSVNSLIKTLYDINNRYRQEESLKEMAQLTTGETKEDTAVALSPNTMKQLIEEHRKRSGKEETELSTSAVDAEIINNNVINEILNDDSDIPEEI